MTIMAGSSQLQSHRNKSKRDIDMSRNNRSKSRSEIAPPHHHDTESDTSGSPVNEFSNMPTYRVPTKSRGGKISFLICRILILYSHATSCFAEIFRPDSSTESNNDNSPIDRRSNTPRHVSAEMRMRPRLSKPPREIHSVDILRTGSNNR